MKGHEVKTTITAVSGAGSVNINAPLSYGILKHIFISAATNTTTFDVSLTDKYDNVTTEYDDNTGVLSELTENMSYGNWTMSISSASVDEVFNIHLVFTE